MIYKKRRCSKFSTDLVNLSVSEWVDYKGSENYYRLLKILVFTTAHVGLTKILLGINRAYQVLVLAVLSLEWEVGGEAQGCHLHGQAPSTSFWACTGPMANR